MEFEDNGTSTLVHAAEEAVARSVVDPAGALATGRRLFRAAKRARTPEAATVALRAMGLAARELGDLSAAEVHLRQAITLPGAPGDRVAQARLSLVTVRTERGYPLQALRVAALAWAYLSPLDRAKLDTQRAVALARLGRYQEAIAACDRSLEKLSESPGTLDDRRFLAGGLLNRGLALAYRGDWTRAVDDLTACQEIARGEGLSHLNRLAAANLPFLAVRRGDLAAAFAHYRAAQETLFGFPERLATMRADFAGALLAAHLPGEARELLSLAVPELESAGAQAALAEARLRLAQVELLTGDPREADAVARRAADELVAQERASWLPLAREVVLRSRLALGTADAGLVTDLIACADELERGAASPEGAADLRLTAAEAALAIDDHPTASAQLGCLTAPTGRVKAGSGVPLASEAQAAHLGRGSRVPVLVRQHALALEAALQEDLPAATQAVLDGLAEVGGQVEVFEDPALRAHAARAGERLATLGLSLAVRDGRAEEIFEWAERWRAVAERTPPGGRPAPEAALAGVRAALGEAALVEYVVEGDGILALVVTGERIAARRLGGMGQVAEAVVRLRYAMRRAALGDGRGIGGEVGVCAEELDRLLLRGLAGWLGDRPLVLVPAGPLCTLPWAALPYLRERPFTVAAGAAAWLAARERAVLRRPAPRVAVAAGPGLEHAPTEVGRVAGCHAGAVRVQGRVRPVLEALGQVDVFHLAAHGIFHSRSPLLSSIMLDDGPLMAYDLLGLRRSAGLVVLSSCESGMARTPCDGAPLGLAGTFLARGTGCVVAGLVPVRDDETVAMMASFHELLASGHSPARALADASAKAGVFGFACFGAGDQPVATGREGSATQLDHEPT
jgi:tetratricopeptide (TPR) repeat protein